MTQEFDPYHVWLGIPPNEQPPDHYRILGVRAFEDVPDVIQNAADQRMMHVRTFQSGNRGAASQQILNEIAAASRVLLTPELKASYDQQLLAQQAASPTQVAGGQPLVQPDPALQTSWPAPANPMPMQPNEVNVQPAPQQAQITPMSSASSPRASAPAKMKYQPSGSTRPRKMSSLPFVIVGGLLGIVTAFGIAAFVTQQNPLTQIFGSGSSSKQQAAAKSKRSSPASSARQSPGKSSNGKQQAVARNERTVGNPQSTQPAPDPSARSVRVVPAADIESGEGTMVLDRDWTGAPDLRLWENTNTRIFTLSGDVRIEKQRILLQSMTEPNLLVFPVPPPDFYSISATVMRLEQAKAGLSFGLVVDGENVDFTIDDNGRSGLENLDGKSVSQRVEGPRLNLLPVGISRSVRIEVQPDRVSLYVSGKLVLRESCSAGRLSSPALLTDTTRGRLILHSNGAAFRIEAPLLKPGRSGGPATDVARVPTSGHEPMPDAVPEPEPEPEESKASPFVPARVLSAAERRANLAMEKTTTRVLSEIKQRDYRTADSLINISQKYDEFEPLKQRRQGLMALRKQYEQFWTEVVVRCGDLKPGDELEVNDRLLIVESAGDGILKLRHANGTIRKAPMDLPFSTALEVVRNAWPKERSTQQQLMEAACLSVNGGRKGVKSARKIWANTEEQGVETQHLVEVFNETDQ